MVALALTFSIGSVFADTLGCVSTTKRWTVDDKVCVERFKDPDVEGVSCKMSYAKTGGIKGSVGLAEDPSRFSISCTQNGPIVAHHLPHQQNDIFSHSLSPLFKGISVTRFYDAENGELTYLATSSQLIDGSPFNSNSSVSLAPWGNVAAQVK